MKRRRLLLPTFLAATLGLTFTACEKKPTDTPKPPQAGGTAAPAPATPGAAPSAASPTTPAPQPVAAAPATAADVAKISATYGFVGKLPKDVEGFSASYRLHDLWTGLANSKWAATLLELPPIKANPDFAKIQEQWKSEQGQIGRAHV